jgi:hypothetical protein
MPLRTSTTSRRSPLPPSARPLRLPRHRLHARDAAREGLSRSGRPLPQERLLAGAVLRDAHRARPPVRRLARRQGKRPHPRERALPGRRAPRRGAAGAAPAPAGALRLVGRPERPRAARRLPPPRPLLLPRPGAARARAGFGPILLELGLARTAPFEVLAGEDEISDLAEKLIDLVADAHSRRDAHARGSRAFTT